MEHNKGKRKADVQATALQKTDGHGKDDHREQDPGTGYYKGKDPGDEHLKNSVIRHKWEH